MMIEMISKMKKSSLENMASIGITPRMIADDYKSTEDEALYPVFSMETDFCMGILPGMLKKMGISTGLAKHTIRHFNSKKQMLNYFYKNREETSNIIRRKLIKSNSLHVAAHAVNVTIPRAMTKKYVDYVLGIMIKDGTGPDIGGKTS